VRALSLGLFNSSAPARVVPRLEAPPRRGQGLDGPVPEVVRQIVFDVTAYRQYRPSIDAVPCGREADDTQA